MTEATPETAAMHVRLRYVHEDRDRHGNVRIYFKRPGGAKTRIREAPDTPEFFERYRALLAGAAPGTSGAAPGPARPAAGTWRALLVSYYASAAYKGLGERTRHVRRLILDATCGEPIAPGAADTFADMPVARLGVRAVTVLRDRKAATPGAANERLKAMRQVLAWWAADEQARTRRVHDNPALHVPYLRGGGDGHHSWSIEEVERFEAHHAVGTVARLALALLLYTGCRRSDVILLGRQHERERGAWLKFTEQKGRERRPKAREIPILPELRAVIDASPCGDLTYIVTEFRRPFSHGGFGNRFRRWCDAAGLPAHCSAHGIRKAGAALAAENGATEQQLMAIYGWTTMKEAERYTRAARKRVLAAAAMPLLARRGGGNEPGS